MSKVGIFYWTGTGNTEAVAELIAEGVKNAGGEAEVFSVDDASAEQAAQYDRLALGCPAMGDEELEDGSFLPFYEELQPSLSGKKIALFGSYSWNDGEWMRTWTADARAAGYDLVADGLAVYDAPDDDSSEDCRKLGQTLALA